MFDNLSNTKRSLSGIDSMSLKFDKSSDINLKSKTNFLITIALMLLTHSVLVYNWIITRNLYNLIFMVAAIVFATLSIIPMIKEYFTKVRLVSDGEIRDMQFNKLQEELSELRDSKKAMQLKLSQEIDSTNELNAYISKFEQSNLEVAHLIEDLQDQILLLSDSNENNVGLVERINELRAKGVQFVEGMTNKNSAELESDQARDDEEQFHQTFNAFMNEFKDMKDLIFQLKTLSFRVDVQASLLNDSEMTQSSSELEVLSRNLAKFYNNVIGLLVGLEADYRKNQDELGSKLETCISEINDYIETKEDISSDLLDMTEQISTIREISSNKLELINESQSEFFKNSEDELDDLVEENVVISATNASLETSSLVQ